MKTKILPFASLVVSMVGAFVAEAVRADSGKPAS
jgi:hypothetical protein